MRILTFVSLACVLALPQLAQGADLVQIYRSAQASDTPDNY